MLGSIDALVADSSLVAVVVDSTPAVVAVVVDSSPAVVVVVEVVAVAVLVDSMVS